MKTSVIILSILILSSFRLMADEWYEVYRDKDCTVYVGEDIKFTNEGEKVWLQWQFNTPQKYDDEYYNYYIEYVEYNKDFDKIRSYTTIFYNENGKVIDSYSTDYPRWQYIIPGSKGKATSRGVLNHFKLE